MSAEFPYDVFLSHSSKDKAVVQPLELKPSAIILDSLPTGSLAQFLYIK